MSHDEYTKLFKYMQQRFAEIDERFENMEQKFNQRFDQIYGLMDAFIKRQETQEQESAAVQNQLNHHDKWIHKLATKISTELS